MALPPGIPVKTVTIGIASFFDGTLAEGKATITAPVNVIHTPTNRPLFSSLMSKPFVDGEVSFNLAPTDAAGLNRVDWTYKLNVVIQGALIQPEPIYFLLPAAGPDTIDLDGLVTVPSSAGIPISVDVLTSAQLPEQMATVAADTDSAFSVAQRAAFGRLPPHAGVRSGYYDPTRSVYNLTASNTRRARAALGAARAGTGLARLTFVGDSLTAGFGNTRGTDDAVSLLRAELVRRGYPVGELVQRYNGYITEPRWAESAAPGYGGDNFFPWRDIQPGQTAAITATGTAMEIIAATASSFTYTIDGGAAATYTSPGGAADVARIQVTGLANTAHTLVITGVSSPTYIFAAGFRPSSGIVLMNSGASGSTTETWNSTGDYALGFTLLTHDVVDTDCFVIEVGVNDIGLDGATFRTRLEGVVEKAKATGATVLLVASQYISGQDVAWPGYVSVIYDVADAEDVPLLDLADRWGLYSQYNADGLPYDLSSDGTHLTPAGNAAKMRAWLDLLAA